MTVFEIRFGLALLAPGRRKRQLGDAFSRVLDEDLRGILPFDHEAAEEAAIALRSVAQSGSPFDFRDIEIAGISFPRRSATLELPVGSPLPCILGIELVAPWGTPLRDYPKLALHCSKPR